VSWKALPAKLPSCRSDDDIIGKPRKKIMYLSAWFFLKHREVVIRSRQRLKVKGRPPAQAPPKITPLWVWVWLAVYHKALTKLFFFFFASATSFLDPQRKRCVAHFCFSGSFIIQILATFFFARTQRARSAIYLLYTHTAKHESITHSQQTRCRDTYEWAAAARGTTSRRRI
jgi:hypothetical protein